MRIVSGQWRGKRIVAPKNLPVRPTTDFAKESLFNILNNHVYFDEIKVLDLFSGTGNITYEFASRGCTDITCVDQNSGCTRFIQKTTGEMGIELQIIQSDALSFLRRSSLPYDIIFADPPYDYDGYKDLIDAVFQRNLLAKKGDLILEHSEYEDLSELPGFYQKRKYGHVCFSFFARPEDIEE